MNIQLSPSFCRLEDQKREMLTSLTKLKPVGGLGIGAEVVVVAESEAANFAGKLWGALKI